MRYRRQILFAAAAAIGLLLAGVLPSAAAPPSSSAAGRSVIVVLRDQLAATPADAAHVGLRRLQANSQQNAVLARHSSGSAITVAARYTIANAFAATVSPAQEQALAADPAVATVIPNMRVPAPAPPTARTAAPGSAAVGVASPPPAGVCPSDSHKPLLEPEALSDTNLASDNPAAKTAQQLATGAGVRVGFIADGLDPASPDFIRADGSHVIVDYRAFSVDGPNPSQGGAEAYGDASMIGAQGRVPHDLSTFVNPAYPLPKGCTIRILGAAPGASIVALKADYDTVSIVQAIDYAVGTAHVDVLNESFGRNGFPDAARGAVALFDDLAVAAGTTVTVSSGDAGTTSTIGDPATDPNVISVAATTTARAWLQTGDVASRLSNGTWVNDQISALSSGGFTQRGGTVDLAAPGEVGWAACNADSFACASFRGPVTGFQLFGGTSMSAPLTAGAAALVIQAYRSTHHGASPSPALVKQLLTSTAKDLGLPTVEQGSGLLDARAAVEAALTYPGAVAVPAGLDSHLVLSAGQLNFAGAPGSVHRATVGVTNAGPVPETVTLGSRDYATVATQNQTINLDANSGPAFPSAEDGSPWTYKKVTFAVPAATQRLVAAMYWNSRQNPFGNEGDTPDVRITLLDPTGAYVANSIPQGGPVSSNYANLDVRRPAAGTWTAIVYTPREAGGYFGRVGLQTTAQRTVPIAATVPSTLTLAPGQRKNVVVTVTTPLAGGDTSQAITVTGSHHSQSAIGVVLRSIVPIVNGAATFSGTITGGNGRGPIAQTLTYAFDVPRGLTDLGVGIRLDRVAGDLIEAVLIDPNGEPMSVNDNDSSSRTVQMTTVHPIPGRWRVVIAPQNPVAPLAASQTFTGRITFDRSRVAAVGLPTSPFTRLARGRPVTARILYKNTGIAPVQAQIDARRTTMIDMRLTPYGSDAVELPFGFGPTYIVPPGTTGLTFAALSPLPVLAELVNDAGGVDAVGSLRAAQVGGIRSVATVAEPSGTVSTGYWYTQLAEIGPFGSAGAPAGTATVSMVARTPAFDTAVTSAVGDPFAYATNPAAGLGSPLLVPPGQTGALDITITPNAPVGTTVRGVLNIVTSWGTYFWYPYQLTGDVLASVPYSYTVAP